MQNVPMKIERFAYDMIYYVLWIVEVVLFLRFALKLLAANPANEAVAFFYSISLVLVGPFNGMFGTSAVGNMILEPSVLIAMVFYAIIGYILVSFVKMIGSAYGRPPYDNTVS